MIGSIGKRITFFVQSLQDNERRAQLAGSTDGCWSARGHIWQRPTAV